MAKNTTAAKAAETASKAVEVKNETTASQAPAAAEKAEAPKKTTTKKAAEKKTTAKKTVAEKKPAAKKAKADTQANIFIQYQGVELSYADLVERAKADSGVKSPKSVNIYIKPEDNMVYYVVDEKVGGFELA